MVFVWTAGMGLPQGDAFVMGEDFVVGGGGGFPAGLAGVRLPLLGCG